jgi:uncharacterized membrane protein YkoI
MASIRTKLMTVAAIGAAAISGSAIASAATSQSGSSAVATTTAAPPGTQQARPPVPPRDPAQGGHEANGRTEALLSGDTAAKVKAAALAKVSGGTVERVETDADHGSPYEAHVRTSDGTAVEVLVNKAFEVTAVNTMGQR